MRKFYEARKKAQSHHTKKSAKSNQKSLNKWRFFLSKYIPKNRKAITKTTIAVAVVVAIAGAIPLPYTFAKSVVVPFAAESKKDAGLELGDSKVLQEGREGREIVDVESLQSVWGRLLGWRPIGQKEVAKTITKEPVNKVVANGTRKYQYMLCSDGSYRYHTDKQFKDAEVGFTSKSDDYCNENNQGHKLSVTNSRPSTPNNSSTSGSTNTTQTYSHEAERIDREVAKLRWCSREDERIGDEYMGKVQQAQATYKYDEVEEFNAIVDPAYWKYSNELKGLRAAGCTINNPYPDYTRR